MIVNHTINKVINSTEENTESLLDLTSDSVSPENLLLNKTAHNSEGEGIVGEMPEGGAKDYDELENRPRINSNLLTGNKTGGQLGLQNKNLDSPIVIGEQTVNTVEGALSALNESKSDLVNGKVPVNELPVYTPVIGSIQSIGGIVPPSSSGDEDKYLRADGTWAKPSGGGGGVSDYDDLTNRPKVNGTTLSGDKTGTQLGLQNVVLASALTIGGQTVTEVEEALESLAGISKSMTGATSSAAGEGGFVPSPSAGDENKALFGDGTWKPVSGGGGGHTILDEDGTTYPQRSKLQFNGAIVTDDSTNDKTKVAVTPSSIGAIATDGASTNTTVAFTSNDLAANTTAKTSNTTNRPSTVVKLESGETLASMFGKISSMFASIRKLWNTVGTTAIPSSLGTTVTGAINTLSNSIGNSPVILWSNDSGVKTGTLTLSDSLSNYSYLQLDIEGVDTGYSSYGRGISNKYHVSCFSSHENYMRALVPFNSYGWYGVLLGAITLSKQSNTSLSIAQNFFVSIVSNGGTSDGSNIGVVARRQSGNCKLYKIIGIK